MGSSEDYLERLLRNVTDGVPIDAPLEPEEEQEEAYYPGGYSNQEKTFISESEPYSENVPPYENESADFGAEINQAFGNIRSTDSPVMPGQFVPESPIQTGELPIGGLPTGEFPIADNISEDTTGFGDISLGEEGIAYEPGLGDNTDYGEMDSFEIKSENESPKGPETIYDPVDIEDSSDLEEAESIEEPAELEETEDTEEPAELEEAENIEEPAESEEAENIEEPAELEETEDTEEPAELEEAEDTEEPAELEEAGDTEEPAELEEDEDTEEPADEEESENTEEPVDEEESGDTEDLDEAADIEEPADATEEIDFEDTFEEPIKLTEEEIKNEESFEDEDISSLLRSIEEMENPIEENDEANEETEEALPEETPESLSEEMDLNDMLNSLGDDGELSEIGELLEKDENSEQLDEVAEAAEESDEFDFAGLSGEDMYNIDEAVSEDLDLDDGSEKKKKKKEKKDKRPGFFARLLALLFEEVGGEDGGKLYEENALDIAIEGAADNEKLLNELGEGGKPAPKKKDKKKEKKPKKEKPKKEKKPKEKKPKKEKPPKEPKVEEPIKRLPLKRVIPIFLLCFSIGAIIGVAAMMYPYYLDSEAAKSAYDHENYYKAYISLMGHNLDEEQQLLFNKTSVILKMEHKYDSYVINMKLNRQLEALNSLVQGIKLSDDLYEQAAEYDVIQQFNKFRNMILEALNSSFGVSEEKAREWLSISDSEEYSRALKNFVEDPIGNSVEISEQPDNEIIAGEESEFFEQQPEQSFEVENIDDLDALDEYLSGNE